MASGLYAFEVQRVAAMSNATAVDYRETRKAPEICAIQGGWKFTGFMSLQRPTDKTEKYYRVFRSPTGGRFWRHAAFGRELTMVVSTMLRAAKDARAAGKQVDALGCIKAFFVKSSHRI